MNNVQTKEKHAKEMALLDSLYSTLPVGQQVRDFSMADHIRDLGMAVSARTYPITFEGLGIVKREGPVYGSAANGLPQGRHYFYTLVKSHDEARDTLRAWQEEEEERIADLPMPTRPKGSKNKRTLIKEALVKSNGVTLASDEAEVTRAIAGPEMTGLATHVDEQTLGSLRSMRKDESAALVEAARQYFGRTDKLGSMLDEFERSAKELGMAFDREAALSMFTMDRDERLEHVALAIPYIASLEKRIESLTTQVEEMRRKVADRDQLERDVRVLRRESQQRVASAAH